MDRRMKKMVYLNETIWFIYPDELIAYNNLSQEKIIWKNPMSTTRDPDLLSIQSWIGLPVGKKIQFITCPKSENETDESNEHDSNSDS